MCLYLQAIKAGVVKLVDTLDLGSSASRRGGSSPFTRTKKPQNFVEVFLFQCFCNKPTAYSLVRYTHQGLLSSMD